MKALRPIALCLLLASSAACGGKSAVESSQSSGGSSSGGGGTSALGGMSASAGSSAMSRECPATPPKVGAACNYTGGLCNYPLDACSSASFVCVVGAWEPAPQLDGARPTCTSYGPGAIPADGASCLCQGVLDCSIDDCNGQGLVHAVCDNANWHVTSEPCADRACGPGGIPCKVGEVCVLRVGGLSASYTCHVDPCAGLLESTSCECAASLCNAPSERCLMNNGAVECVCDTC